MTYFSKLSLYWRVCLINGLVFVGGVVILAVSPATVSTRPTASETVVLAIGIVVILATNALLLRANLAPLDRLIKLTESVDLVSPGQRLPETGSGSVGELVRSFNAMLSRLEIERSTSNARALSAQESERHRIAQELHDEVGQGLTAVLLGLKRSADRAPDDVAGELRTVLEIARSSLDEVRDVAQRLRPGVLEDLGLFNAIVALSTDFSAHSGIEVRRGFAPGLPELSRETELVIYRVAQEALTNVARHADAKTVTISLSMQGDGVALRVVDDGIGLSGQPEGAGIRGMRERALLANGSLTIRRATEQGTELRLIVPVGTVS